MDKLLTPVEALQQKIESVQLDIDEANAHGHQPWPDEYVLVAALAVAKAVAEREDIVPVQVVLRLRELLKVLKP